MASGKDAFIAGHAGTRPGEPRKPTTLQKLAGLRSEPPRSVPSASGTMPAARATAAPPLDPPQVRVVSQGFSVAPNTVLKVWEPAPNSGVLVFPTVMAPAAFMRETTSASSSGTKSRKSGEPKVVRTPLVNSRSLCATGRPASRPVGSPRASFESRARASARAASSVRVTMALSFGFRASICAR